MQWSNGVDVTTIEKLSVTMGQNLGQELDAIQIKQDQAETSDGKQGAVITTDTITRVSVDILLYTAGQRDESPSKRCCN
jgi:hypothetical protein